MPCSPGERGRVKGRECERLRVPSTILHPENLPQSVHAQNPTRVRRSSSPGTAPIRFAGLIEVVIAEVGKEEG